jgi:hypothetical protein
MFLAIGLFFPGREGKIRGEFPISSQEIGGAHFRKSQFFHDLLAPERDKQD